ncbi:MAG TPA: flagellin [bacterium]
MDFTASSAEFNSQKIFSGQAETFLVSPDGSGNVSITIPEVSSASLGLDQIDVSTRAGAEAAISRTDAALDSILEIRTNTGATQNRLESTINSLSRTEVDTLQSLSGIRDANIAEEVLKASAASTRLEAQLAVIAQVNKLNGSLVSQLLGES